jgi:hypothetical protein
MQAVTKKDQWGSFDMRKLRDTCAEDRVGAEEQRLGVAACG